MRALALAFWAAALAVSIAALLFFSGVKVGERRGTEGGLAPGEYQRLKGEVDDMLRERLRGAGHAESDD